MQPALRKEGIQIIIEQGGSRRPIAEPSSQPAAIATFLVRVQFRQNATWQGRIHWLENKKYSSFTSVLEMMNLLQKAWDEKSISMSGGQKDET